MKFTCINIQGNLISEEILQKIEQGIADGQSAKDFGLEPHANLRSEIEYAWSRIKLDWKHFTDKSQQLPANDAYGTTLTRRWMDVFFDSLGFNLSRKRNALVGGNNQSYVISSTAENLDDIPIQVVGFIDPANNGKNTLDIKSSGGTSRLSPHATVQEYLNVTEYTYGIAANGLFLRLIRDSGRLVKLTYLEFDLKRMLDEDKYSEFTLLYRLLHASRFPANRLESDQCFLEIYYRDSIETGNRIRDGLSYAVKESLIALGRGFLQHEANNELRQKLQKSLLSPKDFYRQLLRLIYRFLFLMVTEERDLVYNQDEKEEDLLRKKRIYLQFYSIERLRKLSENRYLYEKQFTDLWQGLINSFQLFEAHGKGEKLGILPLDGDLFNESAIQDIEVCLISNELLLECIRNLNEFTDENKNLVPINYRSLDVEELGSVYEGLLELHPVIENIETFNPIHINFTFHEGTERKTTGSYYTRPDLVNELIKSALIPVIEERIKQHAGKKEAQCNSLLALKVCDAAAGSGHMLLAAARTIAWYLARIQSGEDNPTPSVYRNCLRDVIQHCVYGVDMNPDAVELCKLALWLESHNSGKPLSFLDHKIRCGNSLVGVTDLSVLNKGIPDEAYNPITGDDKEVCKELKKANSAFNKTKQSNLFDAQLTQVEVHEFSTEYNELERIKQDDVQAVQNAKTKFEKLRSNVKWWKEWRACNLWTASFFFKYSEQNKLSAPTSERLQKFLQNSEAAYGPMIGKANAMAMENGFFHWPLEFPDVFEQGGFDVMLGNPPWVEIQPEEQVFFSTRSLHIASLTGAKRKAAIEKLRQDDINLYDEWYNYKAKYEATSKFIRESSLFELTAVGKLNTYSLFSELILKLTSKKGRSSFIIPIGIVTDFGNRFYFSKLVTEKKLVSTYGFINTKKIFPGIKDYIKFCLITIGYSESTVLMFFLEQVSDLLDVERKVILSNDEIKLLNPNSLTCPIFRTTKDAELTLKVYKNGKVLLNKEKDIVSWKIRFKQGLFNMTSDSHLFLDRNNVELMTYPLYEAKMIWHYDQRFSTYENATQQNINEGNLPQFTETEHQDPFKRILPKYWVKKADITEALNNYSKKWFFIGRGIAPATNERTFIYSIIPFSGVGHSATFIDSEYGAKRVCLLLANFNSLIYDFVGSQKLGGPNLSAYILEQLPPIEYDSYSFQLLSTILKYTIELQYTSWDIKAFADDIWKEADKDQKASVKKQWEENTALTGGHEWNPPKWCDIEETGCPLPPFKWNEDRRSILKAELDAIYARLYGLTTEELRYILDPQDVYGPDFPGETFRVLREKEIKQFGEYRTRRLILEAWEKLNRSEELGPAPAQHMAPHSMSIDLNNTSTAMKEWSLHDGIYNIQDCARITRLSTDKIRRWFGELYKENYEGFKDQRKSDTEKLRISFHGLIELVVIGTLRDNQITLKKILAARKDLKSKTKKEYPFATNNVRDHLNLSGSDIVFQFPEGWVTLNGSGQINLDFIRKFFKEIHFNMDGIAESLIPEKGKGKISINPKEANGKPAVTKKEVPVDVILQFYSGSDSVKKIQEQFSLEEDEVLAAIEYGN
jgi:uncharacterized protein (DUF433 family)